MIMATLPPARAGVGSAVNDTVREFGGALGVAVIGSVAATSYATSMRGELDQFPNLTATDRSMLANNVGAAIHTSQHLGAPGRPDRRRRPNRVRRLDAQLAVDRRRPRVLRRSRHLHAAPPPGDRRTVPTPSHGVTMRSPRRHVRTRRRGHARPRCRRHEQHRTRSCRRRDRRRWRRRRAHRSTRAGEGPASGHRGRRPDPPQRAPSTSSTASPHATPTAPNRFRADALAELHSYGVAIVHSAVTDVQRARDRSVVDDARRRHHHRRRRGRAAPPECTTNSHRSTVSPSGGASRCSTARSATDGSTATNQSSSSTPPPAPTTSRPWSVHGRRTSPSSPRPTSRRSSATGTTLSHVMLRDGSTIAATAAFVKAPVVPRSSIARTLGCEIDDDGYIVTERHRGHQPPTRVGRRRRAPPASACRTRWCSPQPTAPPPPSPSTRPSWHTPSGPHRRWRARRRDRRRSPSLIHRISATSDGTWRGTPAPGILQPTFMLTNRHLRSKPTGQRPPCSTT